MGRRRQDDCRCAPPTPTLVSIFRNAYKEAIADYAGLATVTWSTGTTGYKRPFLTFPTDIPNSNFNCFYYKEAKLPWLTTDLRVFPPVRYRFSAGLTNYDHAEPYYRQYPGTTQISQAARHGCTPPASSGPASSVSPISETQYSGVSTKLLSIGSNAEFYDGFASVYLRRYGVGMTQEYANVRNLANPATDYLLSNTDGMNFGMYAIQHRVNGAPQGSVITSPDSFSLLSTDWMVDLTEEDEYELDVWFFIQPWKTISGWGPSLNIPQTVLVLGQTSNTENGSLRELLNHSDVNYRYDLLGGAECAMEFYNVNCAKDFNSSLHSYSITLSGQGWTWEIGSNGPHNLLPSNTLFHTVGINGTGIYAVPRYTAGTRYVDEIIIEWRGEFPVITVTPGYSMLLAMGYPTNANIALQYRIPANSHYRSSASTNNADLPGIVFHPAAKWTTQSGTTTLDLVNHTAELTVFGQKAGRELRRTGGTPGAVPSDVPTSITITRINR